MFGTNHYLIRDTDSEGFGNMFNAYKMGEKKQERGSSETTKAIRNYW